MCRRLLAVLSGGWYIAVRGCTGYFDPAAVAAAREHRRWNPFGRTVSEMGLTGVITTEPWHHTYLGGGLADLPAWQAPVPDEQLAAAQ